MLPSALLSAGCLSRTKRFGRAPESSLQCTRVTTLLPSLLKGRHVPWQNDLYSNGFFGAIIVSFVALFVHCIDLCLEILYNNLPLDFHCRRQLTSIHGEVPIEKCEFLHFGRVGNRSFVGRL